MSLLCYLFGHPMSKPHFTDDGKWHQECTRGDLKLDGVIPPQHQHVYGRKQYSKSRGYHHACICGQFINAPDPVKRKPKDAF